MKRLYQTEVRREKDLFADTIRAFDPDARRVFGTV